MLLAVSAAGEEPRDVTFSSAGESISPRTADFYFNGQAIGPSRNGFAAIVAEIRKLPAGSSIVWGPDYARCGACSGAEPACIPKFLYPDLWKELEKLVAERKLHLSSSYPGPFAKTVPSDMRVVVPRVVSLADPLAKAKYSATLDWRVDPRPNDEQEKARSGSYAHASHDFFSLGRALSRSTRDWFFTRVSEETNPRLLVKIAPSEELEAALWENANRMAEEVWNFWRADLSDAIRRAKIEVVLAAPPKLAEALRVAMEREALSVGWWNYHGPDTPHSEVLYTLGGKLVGRGDEGFRRVLARLGQAEPQSEVSLPIYQWSGRVSMYRGDALVQENQRLRQVAPYTSYRKELDEVMSARKLVLRAEEQLPGREPDTVLDWDGGDRWGAAYVSYGRIVRHDAKPRPAAARLGWSNYDDGHNGEERGRRPRQMESSATYTIDGVGMGVSTAGFEKALGKLAQLPTGSVVHVRVAIRTKAPFLCPITFEGHRHFERTGFEPYFGLFPWLIEVAKDRNLAIEWIPDEGKSCHDCSLNK